MDKRKRTRCKICRNRVNLITERKGNKIYFFCKKCGGHGDVRFKNINN